jgi:hypothetical protein
VGSLTGAVASKKVTEAREGSLRLSASLIVDRAIFWRGADETRTAGADGAATRLR